MRAPAFWWEPAPTLPARLLAPLGAIYGAATARRMGVPGSGDTAGVPVICVGNFVAGGAGKTPTALAVAERLAALGRRPVFLTRGYGGREAGPLLVGPGSEPEDLDARRIGDEAGELAARFPTVVARDRVAGARLSLAAGDVVVMDDGLQNPSLAKTLALAVADAATGLGNGLCVPAGPLRAPLATQIRHVDAVVVLEGAEGARGLAGLEGVPPGVPRLRARAEPDRALIEAAGGRPVRAFAGLGRPEKFFATLRAMGLDVAATEAFADHAPYSRDTIERLREAARAAGAALATTAKDARRVAAAYAPDPVPPDVLTLRIAVRFSDEAALDGLLRGALNRAADARSA